MSLNVPVNYFVSSIISKLPFDIALHMRIIIRFRGKVSSIFATSTKLPLFNKMSLNLTGGAIEVYTWFNLKFLDNKIPLILLAEVGNGISD